MDELTWLSSEKPEPMLKRFLESGDITFRKLLLYACRCVRRILKSLVYQESEAALRYAEDSIEGRPILEELEACRREALRAVACAKQDDGPRATAGAQAAAALLYYPSEGRLHRECSAMDEVGDYTLADMNAVIIKCEVKKCLRILRLVRESLPPEKKAAERQAQARLARCIFGNPFREPAGVANPGWLSSTVVDMAQAIYTKRWFKDLPILADALIDTGCDDAAILDHCRAEGPHGRGCWVVDWILGLTDKRIW